MADVVVTTEEEKRRERQRANTRRYREKHREIVLQKDRERAKRYRVAHPQAGKHTLEYQREYAAKNPEKLREKARRYEERHPGRRAEISRDHRQRRPGKATAEARKQRILYPARVSARKKLCYAIKTGRVARPDLCESCGKSCKPQGHHTDYAKPLNVAWLCASCHKKVHLGEV